MQLARDDDGSCHPLIVAVIRALIADEIERHIGLRLAMKMAIHDALLIALILNPIILP